MQLMTNEIHLILTQWVQEGRNICIYGSENLDWIREFSAKMKEIKDAEVLALLYNNDDNGWAVFGKGLSTDIVRVQGGEIIQCLNLFRQCGENVAQLEFIGAFRTVLEPPLFDGPCNQTEVIPYSEGMIEGSTVCQKCKRLMMKFTIYQ
ncbi:hypothetical protein CRYUN_Cryun29cG0060100 [Craigia yunnanensis]